MPRKAKPTVPLRGVSIFPWKTEEEKQEHLKEMARRIAPGLERINRAHYEQQLREEAQAKLEAERAEKAKQDAGEPVEK